MTHDRELAIFSLSIPVQLKNSQTPPNDDRKTYDHRFRRTLFQIKDQALRRDPSPRTK
jgi:primosomal protein N''